MKNKTTKKQSKTLPKERILTKDEFFRILNKVIRPISKKEKPPEKEKKGTLE